MNRAAPNSIIGGGVFAMLTGLAFLYFGGAPSQYVAVNAGAVLVGIAAWFGFSRVPINSPWFTLAAAIFLLLTALFGMEVDGVRRWLPIGPLSLNPAFIFLPAMIIAAARFDQSKTVTMAIFIAAAAIALQPDRSMAITLFLGILFIWARKRDIYSASALAATMGAVIATFLRSDTVSAVPYVEYAINDAWRMSPVLGIATTIGAATMLIPAIWAGRTQYLFMLFAMIWAALLLLSLIAPYPTPLIGYGASAIIGYFLSLAVAQFADRKALYI